MATKAQTRRFNTTAGSHQIQIVKLLKGIAHKRGMSKVFADWIEMSAIALARLDLTQRDEREARYLQIVGQYEREDVDALAHALSHLVMAFEECFSTAGDVAFADVLGALYMMLDLGNSDSGQFFTPYEVSRLMAGINMTGAKDFIQANGLVQLKEPAAGAGGMIVAAAQALHEEGLNYQQYLHATAIDIDTRCVHMCFVQLSLLHIPAIVLHGNALSNETWSTWYTPAHILGRWGRRLEVKRAVRPAQSLIEAPKAAAEHLPHAPSILAGAGQMTLF
ncbi:SAM-dependent DNA methyltransferase [Pusillimonas caeni]|uniref:N-6 DNA methylase n=1 Tax=Pusillimonas caeni TaxID=1348472 RepID=UPI000E59F0CE|nr:N-6 DNA methylase [Pusillimonas caeni]TFL14046.1 SAM-dependent DNA methyltransferase [Pusillimonas caeni]